MIATILIVLLIIGVVFLVGNLVMMRRENAQLQEDLAQTVPLRESQFKPYVPPQQPHRTWSDVKDGRSTPPVPPRRQLDDGDLDDPNSPHGLTP